MRGTMTANARGAAGRMAYRFLLEVPEDLVDDAVVAVDAAGDAQVVLIRPSHGLGVDDPYMDLTVAAHTLQVVDTLYDWFDSLGASRPDIRIVLHGGDRLPLEAVEREEMMDAIRRDQPWEEHTVPKIGEHMPREGATAGALVAAAAGTTAPVGGESRAPRPFVGESGAIIAAPRPVQIVRLNHIAVKVQELSRPEAFYSAFFGMSVIGRAYRDPDGGFQPAPDDYDHQEAARQGTEADASFLQAGPLTLVLLRAGRDARIDPNEVLGQISIAVDANSLMTIRAETLIRNFEIFYNSDIAITFRDPFGITWEVTASGIPG